MLAAKVCRVCLSPGLAGILKSPVISKPVVPKIQVARLFASDGRTAFTRSAKRSQTIAEQAMAPAGENAYQIGRTAVAGGAVLGLGALCYYGLGLSSEEGALERSALWPQYVKERIRATYTYFGASMVTTALTATACLRSERIMNLMMRQSWVSLGLTMAAVIGSSLVVQSIPYKEGFGAKQVAWLAHTGIFGAIFAPLSLFGGPVLLRAAWFTAGIVGGLSLVAVCAPNEKFLYMGGPLAVGLGAVFASSIGTMFLPPTTRLGAGLHSIVIYGGLLLFSAFLLYDTQRVIKKAESHPYSPYGTIQPYDPINSALSLYMDVLNIFIRMVYIFAGGNNRRK